MTTAPGAAPLTPRDPHLPPAGASSRFTRRDNGWGYSAGTYNFSYTTGTSTAPDQYGGSVPGWASPQAQRARRRNEVVGVLLMVVSGLALLGFVVYMVRSVKDASQLVLPAALALVPLVIVLLTVLWIDRWEPEPPAMLVTAFMWGAGTSVVIAVLLNDWLSGTVAEALGDPEVGETAGAVIAAPLFEEGAKGLGVLVIFFIWRRTFNGPVDGIVYACVIAGAFAFSENIVYFFRAYQLDQTHPSAGGSQLLETFLARGIMTPFTHLTFTSCTGFAVGLASTMRSRFSWVWMTLVGYALAVCGHAFWNGVIASLSTPVLLAVEIPVFLMWIGGIVLLRQMERRAMASRLADYSRASWLTGAEITMLTTGTGRRQARRWARNRGPAAGRAMKRFQKAAVDLAQLRQRAMNGHAESDYADAEHRLLEELARSRRAFLDART